jgi:hypothetical protein
MAARRGERAEYRISDEEDGAPEEAQRIRRIATQYGLVMSRILDASATSRGEEVTVEAALDDHRKGEPTPIDSQTRVRF